MSPKQFKDLKEEWDQKLEEVGFNDIESPNDTLKTWDSCNFRRKRTLNLLNERQRYFQLATQLLNDHPFLVITQTEEEIWHMFCEGMTTREIAQTFKNQGRKLHKNRFYLDKDDVHQIIKELDSIVITLCI